MKNKLRPWFALVAVVALASLPVRPQGRFAFSANSAEVIVPVTVTNPSGGVVTGLTAQDFQIFEDGRPRAVTQLESGDAPVTVGLVVDHSLSMLHGMDAMASAAAAFAAAGNPDDEMFVVNFNDEIRLELPPGAAFATNPDQLRTAVLAQSVGGRTALFDAIEVSLNHLAGGHALRRALVVVSDGGDNISLHTLAQVREAALRAQAVVYTIGFTDEFDADSNPGVLRQLAAATGGAAYFPANADEAGRVSAQIARDLRLQYTLLFAPPPDAAAGYHKISVRLKAPGHLKIRTRAGYYAAAPNSRP